MLSGLDARSGYISEPAFRASQATANDDAATPGLVLTIGNGQLQVISPEDGSPAALAGIRPGDVTFTIDEEPVYETDLERGRAEAARPGRQRSPVGSAARHREAPRPVTQARGLQAPDDGRARRKRKRRLSAHRRV